MAAAALLYAVVGRPRLLTWGASHAEATGPLAGVDLVTARWQTTRGVSISAPAGEVWPWLIQMGYERGGWYSYDWLEPVHHLMETTMLRIISQRGTR